VLGHTIASVTCQRLRHPGHRPGIQGGTLAMWAKRQGVGLRRWMADRVRHDSGAEGASALARSAQDGWGEELAAIGDGTAAVPLFALSCTLETG